MFTVVFTKTSQKAYERLSSKIQKGVDRCVEYIRINPTHGPNIKKLKGDLSEC